MKAPSIFLFGLLLLAACQQTAVAPNPTSPGTSNQVITLQPSIFAAEMAGASEAPAVTSDAKGYGVFLLSPAKDSLTVRVYVAGLSGPVTGAHLHLGEAGKSGEVVKDLTVAGNVITGTWKKSDATQPLTDARVSSLLSSGLYVNVHTEKNPNGEIRGQLSSSNDAVYPLYLSGADEAPPLTGKGAGVAWVKVNAAQSELSLKGSVFELSGPATAAHLHKGAKGVSGEVLKDVTVSGNNLSLSWKKSDTSAPLTPGVLELLLKGELYLNVHTAANANGEIRGQVQ